MKLPPATPGFEGRDKLDAALHDLANALSAVQSYGEVIQLQARSEAGVNPGAVKDLLEELDRAHGILRTVRRQTFRPGDVLRCRDCAHEFVHRKATGRKATCRRCDSESVEKWVQR